MVISCLAGAAVNAAVICTDASGNTFKAASDVGFELAGTQCTVARAPAIRPPVYGSASYYSAPVVVQLPVSVAPAMVAADPSVALESEALSMGKTGPRPAYAALVDRAAKVWGHDPDLLHAVIQVESGYAAGAVSPKGAVGLMQVMPDTARRFGLSNAETALRNPKTNIEIGARYLSTLKRTFGGDLRLALAGYNAGEQAVIKNGNRVPPYPETRAYVRDVIDRYVALKSCGDNSGCP